jgi:hypothetical protein
MIALRLLGVSLIIAALVACSGDPQTRYSKEGVVFDMPEGWEVFEDIHFNDQHRTINLITSIGSLVGVDVLILNPDDKGVDINAYLKRSVASALPTQELQDSASIDFGECSRLGYQCKFVHIRTPEPTPSSFVLEIYQLSTSTGSAFVKFNTPASDMSAMQQEFDRFLGSISI